MIKMTNRNITERGTKTTCLGILIGRHSADSQHGAPDRHCANVGYYFSGTQTTDINRQWTREDNKLALYCNFRSNPTQ